MATQRPSEPASADPLAGYVLPPRPPLAFAPQPAGQPGPRHHGVQFDGRVWVEALKQGIAAGWTPRGAISLRLDASNQLEVGDRADTHDLASYCRPWIRIDGEDCAALAAALVGGPEELGMLRVTLEQGGAAGGWDTLF